MNGSEVTYMLVGHLIMITWWM